MEHNSRKALVALLAAGLIVVAGSSTAMAHWGGPGAGGPGGRPVSSEKPNPSLASHSVKPSMAVQPRTPGDPGWLKGSICATSPTATATPTATASLASADAEQADTKSAVAHGLGLGGDWPAMSGHWNSSAIEKLRQNLCTVDGLKTAIDNEIARREKALTGLISWIGKAKVLSSADAAVLTAEINSLTADLQALKTKVDAATTVPDLQADLKLLQANSTVYRTVWMWVHLVVGAEYSAAAGATFDKVATKISDEIATAKGLGKDTTNAQAQLVAMNAAVAKAVALAKPLSATLLALTPGQLADGSAAPVLTAARTTLWEAGKDFWTARQAAHKALDLLKDLLPKATPAPKAPPTATPT
jgi:hypothetical protein